MAGKYHDYSQLIVTDALMYGEWRYAQWHTHTKFFSGITLQFAGLGLNPVTESNVAPYSNSCVHSKFQKFLYYRVITMSHV